jgi:uncharacterized protein YbcI
MSDPKQQLTGGPLRVAISNAVSQVLVDYTGRGPERVRTTIDADTVMCMFHGSLNRAERKLSEDGRGDLVLQTRHNIQEAMRTDLVDAVSGLTGRPVLAFMSANHLQPDLGVELFVLADGEPPPARPD